MRERKYSVHYKRYNLIGVTTVDEQQVRQQLGQHWFITAYTAVFIQGLYTVYSTTVLEHRVLLPCWNWLGTTGDDSLHKRKILCAV